MNRRKFIKHAGILAGSACLAENAGILRGTPPAPLDHFKLGVISDGLSPDFETALKIMKGYGISWVEIRSVWGKYNTEASPEQVRRIKDLLDQYEFRCSMVDTALFKCRLPGTQAPGADKDIYPYSQQMDLLKRAIDRAHAWGTDRVRIFTFWRVAEPESIYGRIREEEQKAAELAQSAGIRLLIENEPSTNVGTGHELTKMLKTLPSNVGANWDTGNGLSLGEVPYPDGFKALDPKRIWNLHLKGIQCQPGFKDCQEAFSDQGQIDLTGQLRALLKERYLETMSLECEFEARGMSHSETTRRSLQGLLKVVSAAVS